MADDQSSERGLAARRLGCIRADRVVFRELDFALAPGETLRLTGPNGSGKSSLLRILAGLGRPAAGTVTWDGAPVAGDPAAQRARTLHVGHLDPVKPWMTLREHVRFWVRLAGAGTASGADAEAALDRLGLARLADLPGRFLSAGQRRRLALTRLAAIPAPLWLLDEPTVGLDARSTAAVEALIAEHAEAGGVAVVATHTPIRLPGARDLDLEAHERGAPALGDRA